MNKVIKVIIALSFLQLAACEAPVESDAKATIGNKTDGERTVDSDVVRFEDGWILCGMAFGLDSNNKIVEYLQFGESFEMDNSGMELVDRSGSTNIENSIDGNFILPFGTGIQIQGGETGEENKCFAEIDNSGEQGVVLVGDSFGLMNELAAGSVYVNINTIY